jgi:formate dehydrogenase major subunit
MQLDRRCFLKTSALAATGTAVAALGLDLKPIRAQAAEFQLRTQQATETTSICPYCAVGCGLIVHSQAGRVINTEGDPDHPINQGALCPKGSGVFQMAVNEERLTQPLYRGPNSDRWEVKTWDWMLKTMAQRIKDRRDADFMAINAKGGLVNRVESMAHIGSAALDNEECWPLQAMMRSLGLVYIEHQARI